MAQGSGKITVSVVATLVAAFGLLVTSACTDKRTADLPPIRQQIQTEIRSSMQFVADVTFGGAAMNVLSVALSNGSFYVTGFPFGFARFDVSSNPTQPSLLYAAKNNSNTFAADGIFNVDYHASGAVGVWETSSSTNRYAFLSGTSGTLAVDMTSTPRIVLRKPPLTAKGEVQQDMAYVYKGIVASPSKGLLFGWTQDTKLMTLSGQDLSLVAQATYGNGTVCCVKNVVAWNGYMVAAFGSRMVLVPFCGDDADSRPDEAPCKSGAAFGTPTVFDSLQAQYVAATPTHLYVYHEPSDGFPQGLAYRRGIYSFSASTWANDDVFPLPIGVKPRLMAVTPQDTHVYFNSDGQKLDIYRLLRAAQP